MFHAMSTTKVSLSGETQWTNTLWQKWPTVHPRHPSLFTLEEDSENIEETEWIEETEIRPHPRQLVDLLKPSLTEAALDSFRLQAEDTQTSASASLHCKQQAEMRSAATTSPSQLMKQTDSGIPPRGLYTNNPYDAVLQKTESVSDLCYAAPSKTNRNAHITDRQKRTRLHAGVVVRPRLSLVV